MRTSDMLEFKGKLPSSSRRNELEEAASQANRLFMLISFPRLDAINRIDGFEAGDAHLEAAYQALVDKVLVCGRYAGGKLGAVAEVTSETDALDMAADLFEIAACAGVETHVGGAWSGNVRPMGAKRRAALSALDQSRKSGPCGVAVRVLKDGAKNDELSLAKDALAMIRAGAASIALQPVVDAQTPGRVMFREALIRLVRPNGEEIAAGAFMPTLSAMGMTAEVDLAVLDNAATMLAEDPSARISVNVAADTLTGSTWRDRILDIALRKPDVAERLIIEVSEETALCHISAARDLFTLIRRCGVTLALDDFGAGTTSFSHLRDARFDMVKIDGSLIHGIDNSPGDQALVAGMADIGRRLDMMVIAEFVETAQEARVLRKLGVDGFQGYLFGRPTLVWSDGEPINQPIAELA